MEFLSEPVRQSDLGIIRLAVTVGILAAVYFFIVKPVLHTTEHAVDSTKGPSKNPSTAPLQLGKRSKKKSN